MSPTNLLARDMKVSCMLPWWATTDGFMFKDLPWLQFHSLLFNVGTLTQDCCLYID